jgi:hydroxyacylglutathione hydrolase
MNDQNFEEVLPGIFLVKCSIVSIVLAKAERLAVIDTGIAEFMPAAIKPALAALDEELSSVSLIVNTHGHWDHVEGNSSILKASNASVWIPAADVDKLSLPPDRLLVEGDEIDLGGGLCFKVIATPGHSAGMSILYEQTLKLLIVSDAAQGYGTDAFPLYFNSGQQYRTSLQKLLQLDAETVVVGHEFKWSGQSQMVHHGAENVRRFLLESLDAAVKVGNAVRAAVDDCPDRTLYCIQQEAVRHLRNDPRYPFNPTSAVPTWFIGTVCSELRDLSIQYTNSS